MEKNIDSGYLALFQALANTIREPAYQGVKLSFNYSLGIYDMIDMARIMRPSLDSYMPMQIMVPEDVAYTLGLEEKAAFDVQIRFPYSDSEIEHKKKAVKIRSDSMETLKPLEPFFKRLSENFEYPIRVEDYYGENSYSFEKDWPSQNGI